MKPMNEFATKLIEILEDHAHDVRTYSGRCMYGKECVGMDYDHEPEMLNAILDLAVEDINIARKAAKCAKFDSMGRGAIIYWPDAEVQAEECDLDEE